MFATFPNFSKLTLAGRAEYEALISSYPPVSDISFETLMMWWDRLGGLALSRLNGNLVISYWIPGDEQHSGLALIGMENIDESICTIFDYLRERGEEPRLVNVPQFVVNSIQYPELFAFRSGRGDDEYLISLARFAVIDNMPIYMRTRARKFLRETGEDKIHIKPIDLSDVDNQALLLDAVAEWPLKGVNNINKLEREILPNTVKQGVNLGMRSIGMYIDGVLQAYCLYFLTKDKDHAVIGHVRVNYEIPRIFDYIVHTFSKHIAEKGVKYINLDADNGSLKMRALKIALKPENFFRKYSIEPMS